MCLCDVTGMKSGLRELWLMALQVWTESAVDVYESGDSNNWLCTLFILYIVASDLDLFWKKKKEESDYIVVFFCGGA